MREIYGSVYVNLPFEIKLNSAVKHLKSDTSFAKI